MGVACFLIFLIVFWLTACASQNRQVKAHYKYTRTCEFTVAGAEVQSGDKVGTGAEILGDECIIGRDTSAEKTPTEKPEN